MATYTINGGTLTGIADAIRAKGGTSDALKPGEMAAAIDAIETGGETTVVSGWQRPAEWPDYSKVDPTTDHAIYLTYDCRDTIAGTMRGFAGFYNNSNTEGLIIERGTLTDGVFTPVFTTTISKKIEYQEWLPTDEGDYVVYRLTSQNGSEVSAALAQSPEVDGQMIHFRRQPCVEIYGDCTLVKWFTYGVSYRGNIPSYYCKAITLKNYAGIQLSSSFDGGESNVIEQFSLEDWTISSSSTSFEMRNFRALRDMNFSSWDMSHLTSLKRFVNNCYALQKLTVNGETICASTNMESFMENCHVIEEADLRGIDLVNVTTLQNAFRVCNFLRDLKLYCSGICTPTTINYAFGGLNSLSSLDLSFLSISSSCNTTNAFYACNMLTDLKIGSIGNSLALDYSPLLTHDSLIGLINALETTDTALTLTLGTVNLAKLTDEEIAVATEKGWTLA